MTKPIAREGDVSTAVGGAPFTGATSGTWTAGTVVLTTTDVGKADGRTVVTAASCTFSFSGTNGQSPVTGTSTVELTAGSHQLTFGTKPPLVDGDAKQDSFGNVVTVGSSATWKTT